MAWRKAGACPACGAPIYEKATSTGRNAPEVSYSCECRNRAIIRPDGSSILPATRDAPKE